MKNRLFSIVLLGAFLFAPLYITRALEIEFIGGVDNLTYHPDRLTAHSQSINFREFQSYPFIFGDLKISNEISDKMGFKVSASRDNILWNSLDVLLTAKTDYFDVEFGPFIGISDEWEKPIFGITGSFKLMYPGIIYLALEGSSSFDPQFDFVSNDSRNSAKIELGFWLPNIIPSFSVCFKNFTRHPDDLVTITDELLRLMLSADIFAKNFPLSFRVDGGYQILKRGYNRIDSDFTDEINTFFVNAEVRWQISKPFKIIAGFELPIFTTYIEPMVQSEDPFGTFKAYAGFTLTFFDNDYQ